MTPDSSIVIGIDFDDTLWHTTPHFTKGREILEDILDKVTDGTAPDGLVASMEEQRITTYGYGYASFVLAGIEALLTTNGRTRELATIEPLFEWTREISEAPVRLLPGVEETLSDMATRHRLIGITRGSIPTQIDLFLRSGLGGYFKEVEVIGRKTIGRYQSILRRHEIDPDRFIMIGDSLGADIEPALAAGGYAIHIPYAGSWEDKRDREDGIDDALRSSDRWVQIDSFTKVPAAIESLMG